MGRAVSFNVLAIATMLIHRSSAIFDGDKIGCVARNAQCYGPPIYIHITKNVESWKVCRNLCDAVSQCQAFSYSRNRKIRRSGRSSNQTDVENVFDGQCRLYEEKTSPLSSDSHGPHVSNSGTQVWILDTLCPSCACGIRSSKCPLKRRHL